MALLLIHARDHVGREVDDLLQVLRSDVQQVAETARHALEEPDVGDGGGQLDVAHALAAHAGLGDLHAAPFADDALEAHALVLAEQTVLLGLQGTVVNGFRLLDLAVAPIADVVGGGQADPQFVKCVDVQHSVLSCL